MPRLSSRSVDPPASITDHAAENLRFIRHTMERSATFTAVPGWGGAAMGVVGVVAAGVASTQPTPERWLATWLAAAIVASAIGIVAITRKMRRGGVAVQASRRFALGLAAPLVAGAALTGGLWLHGVWTLMPPVWLLLYGTGVVTGGAFSVAAVRAMGLGVMALGMVALVTPASWGDIWLAAGFGVLQIGFGIYIARKHGG